LATSAVMIAGNGPHRVAAKTTTARYISSDRCSISWITSEYFSTTKPAVTLAIPPMALAEPTTTVRGPMAPATDAKRSAKRKHTRRVKFDLAVNSGPASRICIPWALSPTQYTGIQDFRIDLFWYANSLIGPSEISDLAFLTRG